MDLKNSEKEEISHALADVLCWFRGFEAARPPDAPDVLPPGIDTLRNFNIKLKRSLVHGQGGL